MPIVSNAIVTAYCACHLCCGLSGGTTASGSLPREGVTVAGPRGVALGTAVFIPGVGRRSVQDRTTRRFDGRWDVYFKSHAKARAFGKRRLNITILSSKTK